MRNRPIPGSSGLVRAMSLFGDPVLHSPCEDVTDFGPSLATLVEDMFATMYAAQGVGLA
ncbi:peptide deformylase, partial [Streptomyces clavifer]